MDFINKYWNKVDLHSHTLNGITRNGCNDSCGYTHKEFLKRLINEGFKIKAVTNHNTLFLCDHIKHAIICKMANVTYIPGVELDLNLTGKPFQAIFLFAPENDICSIANKINLETVKKKKLLSQTTKNFYYSEDDLLNLIKDCSFIFIPHARKAEGICTSKKSILDDENNFLTIYNAIESALAMPILFENTKPTTSFTVVSRMKSITNNECVLELAENEVTTTDDKFDGEPDRQKHKALVNYAINSEATYKGLVIAIFQYQTRFKYIPNIPTPVNFIESIQYVIQEKNFKDFKTIELSPYLNAIIGNSGTGKTLLLNQIYWNILNQNLNVGSKASKDNLYRPKVSNDEFLKVNWYNGNPGKIIELKKIYSELLKIKEGKNLSEIFGLSQDSNANVELKKFISDVAKFERYCVRNKELEDNISANCQKLFQIFKFLSINKLNNNSYNVEINPFDENKLNSLLSDKNELVKTIENFESFKKSELLQNTAKFLGEENTTMVENLINSINEIQKILKLKARNTMRKLNIVTIDKIINEKISSVIFSINQILGDKQKAITDSILDYKKAILDIGDSICRFIKNNCIMRKTELKYPRDKINKCVEEENENNHFARKVVIFDDEFKVKFDDINNNPFFNTKVIDKKEKTEFNILESNGMKSLCELLVKKYGVLPSTIISGDLNYDCEFFVKGEWKSQTQINPGTLAKIYMDYFFNDIVIKNQPNVIFIDQPENDVDKTFITDTLATFLTNNKQKIQFIITTHEPILAVNGDANVIIESTLNGENKFVYSKYNLETVLKDKKFIGTESVADILDGGKKNVVKRNKIYGGSIDD